MLVLGLFVSKMFWVFVVCVLGGAAGSMGPQWWDSAVYYRMLVDSFRDSDGDGLGDLKGELVDSEDYSFEPRNYSKC